MRHYKTAVLADINKGISEISNIFCESQFQKQEINQVGIMTTRFVKVLDSFKLVDVKGDCLGVTGYSLDEIKGQDIMRLLKLSPSQLGFMYQQAETKGFCAKITNFTKKNNTVVQVFSILKKIAENTYEETTILSDSITEI